MLQVWRLVTARYADSAFSGDGARLYGGRWNRKGVPVVYTSDSQALAMLEMLVQDDPLRARYVVIPATIPDEVAVERVTVDSLPARWRAPGEHRRLRTIGTAWARRLSSAVLAVPSAVIPDEHNYLLNPQHEAFSVDRDRRAPGVRHGSAVASEVGGGSAEGGPPFPGTLALVTYRSSCGEPWRADSPPRVRARCEREPEGPVRVGAPSGG